MKKLLFTIIIVLTAFISQAQNQAGDQSCNRRIYSIVVMDANNAHSPVVMIKETTDSGSAWSGFDYKSNYLRDEEGNELKFNNFLPLLGYLQSIGWTIPDIDEQIYKNQSTAVSGRSVFLVYKDVPEEQWLQWIENGKYKKKK